MHNKAIPSVKSNYSLLCGISNKSKEEYVIKQVNAIEKLKEAIQLFGDAGFSDFKLNASVNGVKIKVAAYIEKE